MEQNPDERFPTINDAPDAPGEEEWQRQGAILRTWCDNAFNAFVSQNEPEDTNKTFLSHSDFHKVESAVLPRLKTAGFTDERLARYAAYHHYLLQDGYSFKQSPKVDFPGKYSMKEFYRQIIEQYGGKIPTPEQEEWQIEREKTAHVAHYAREALTKHFGAATEEERQARSNEWEKLRHEYLIRLHEAGFTNEQWPTYAAWHILFGSGIVYDGTIPHIDFPGDLSVRKFYEDIIAQYGD
jgi:hypothetical protein